MAINTLQFKLLALIKAVEHSTGKTVDRVGADADGFIKVFFKDGTSLEHAELIKLIGDRW